MHFNVLKILKGIYICLLQAALKMVEVRQTVGYTAQENALNFTQYCSNELNDLEDFLHRNDHITIRSTNFTQMEQNAYLTCSPDTDGIVIELSSYKAINFQISHLNFLPDRSGSMKYVYPMLKKHLDLPKYKRAQDLEYLRKCRGFQLFYENSWECYLCLLPKQCKRFQTLSDEIILKTTYMHFDSLITKFKSNLLIEYSKGKCVNTLKKTQCRILKDCKCCQMTKLIYFLS